MSGLTDRLVAGCAAMGINLPAGADERFALYDTLLRQENTQQNLTRDIGEPDAIERLYLDSLTPLTIQGLIPPQAHIADVGSGAGLPGIPLAIARPDIHITLIESIGKRAAFLTNVVQEIDDHPDRFTVANTRVEDFARSHRGMYDCVVCRAVAPLAVLLEYAAPIMRVGGRLIAYKGPGVSDEIREAARAAELLGAALRPAISVCVPGTDWHHTLVIAIQEKTCPEKYPRRAGMAERKPLVQVLQYFEKSR